MKIPQTDSETPELAFRAFIRAFGLLKSRMEPYFAEFGISGAQWGILRQLHRAEAEGKAGLNQTDLVARLLVKPPSVTGVVHRLVHMGLVARRVAGWDQRVREITLTPTGRKLIARVLEHHPLRIRRMLACFDDAEKEQLHRLMDRFVSHLTSIEPGPATPGKRRVRLRRSMA